MIWYAVHHLIAHPMVVLFPPLGRYLHVISLRNMPTHWAAEEIIREADGLHAYLGIAGK